MAASVPEARQLYLFRYNGLHSCSAKVPKSKVFRITRRWNGSINRLLGELEHPPIELNQT